MVQEKVTSATLKDLAAKYNVDCRTMKRWLKPFLNYIGKPVGYVYMPLQVRKIIEKLGEW